MEMKEIFKMNAKPYKGLFAYEYVILIYAAITLLFALFAYTKLSSPNAFIWGRMRIVAMMGGLWVVYRLVPCRFTAFIRVGVQMGLLAWWYPDTYEINRILPNLDHLFAHIEQVAFGFQPALVFAEKFSSPVVSELMSMGYACYYPIIVLTTLMFFFNRYEEFHKCVFVIMASFFTYYIMFDFIPVAGPTYYYHAVGLDNIMQGVFPNIGHYFNDHKECLSTPGYTNGFFYSLVEDAKAAGERPTAAFPSSHVGVSTVCMLLLMHARFKKLWIALLPVYAFLCMATVYIQAHYAIDAIAGFVSAIVFYFFFMNFYTKNEKSLM